MAAVDEPKPSQSSTLSSKLLSAGAAVDKAWKSRAVQNAIQLLDQLSDLGQTIPFIAPAFVLLSLIIQIETRARDADAKCTDLLERVTFMMGHLSVLRRIRVMEETRRVIDRMNDVLRDAASLIQAYRKQNAIVRRLHIGNIDRFSASVEAVNLCSSDLMMSLQIHQTSQLEILTRSVPIDREDEVARAFITNHGGIETVRGDPKLVSRFAEEALHMTVGDGVMEQINTNLSDLIAENRLSLERMLSGTVSTAIVDGIKELVSQVTAADLEQRSICVQCGDPFRNSTNGPASCNYHRAEDSGGRIKFYPCCGSKDTGCQLNFHRAVHHCEYPYGSLFSWVRNINCGGNSTVSRWIDVEDKNLITKGWQGAYVGQLLRWVANGYPIEESTIILSVGTVQYTEKYFFDSFTSKDLDSATQILRMTGNKLIFRNSPGDDEYSMAEWELSETSTIAGIRITVKVVTSEAPFIKVCPINVTTCTKSGEVQALSEGGLRSYTPKSAYTLPETIRISHELSDKPVRPTRMDFRTKTSLALPIILRPTTEPPLKPNVQIARYDSDNFEGAVSVLNKSPLTSAIPITIVSVSATFRLVGDGDYLPVQSLELLDGAVLPINIESRQSSIVSFRVALPRTDGDIKLRVGWRDRAFIARKCPVRVKLLLEDIEGEKASIVIEHVFDPRFPPEKQTERDIGYFYFDDRELWSRNGIHVQRPDSGPTLLYFSDSVGDGRIDAARLQRIVYEALKSGETEVDLKIGSEKGGGAWEWGAWALVDLSCRKVYAFKILIQEGKRIVKKRFGCLGYIRCPEYGDVIDEIRPIQYADEIIKLPPLEPLIIEDIPTDDTLDDIVPETPKPAEDGQNIASSIPAFTGQLSMSDDLATRLSSIDTKLGDLSRIADALESLVAHFTKPQST